MDETLGDPNAPTLLTSSDGRRPSAGEHRRALEPGDAVGRYAILGRVGAGGMGVVYAAYDPTLDRKVALKILRNQAAQSGASKGRQRLMREAQAMARLSHPNVITVHDVGEHEGAVFVAMEFIEGETLREHLEANEHTRAELLELFIAAGQGLVAAHAAGLIHRDFKPDNVMVGEDGRVRVLDFGLARPTKGGAGDGMDGEVSAVTVTPHDLASPLTAVGQIMGTPAYMAPEQHRGAQVDARCDQFSFCVALYEALYGERPYGGDTIMALVYALSEGLLREAPADSEVPVELRERVVRGLAHEPEDRYPDMAALVEALVEHARPLPPARERRLGLAFAAALALVAGGAAFGWARAFNTEPDEMEDPCAQALDQLAGVWDEGARTRVREAFVASQNPIAETMSARVETKLDAYAERWLDGRRAACEATRVAHTQSDELMDLRMQCLDRARDRLGVFVGALEQADAATVERATDLVRELGELERCADAAALRRTLAPPSDPAQFEQVEQLRARLDRNATQRAAGKYGEAHSEGEPLVERARELDYAPLLGETLAVWGRLLARVGDVEGSEAAYLEAYYVGVEAGDEDSQLSAALDLSFVRSQMQGRFDDAHHWALVARALARKLGRRYAEAKSHRLEGIVNLSQGHAQRAQDCFERALGFYGDAPEQLPDKQRYERANLLQDLWRNGWVNGAETERTQAAGREAELEMLELLGPDHPGTVGLRGELATKRAANGDYAEALEVLEAGLVILERVHGPEHFRVLVQRGNIASLRFRSGEQEQGLAQLEALIADTERVLGVAHEQSLAMQRLYGRLRVTRGEYELGVARFELALRDGAERLASGDPQLVDLAVELVDTLGEAGQPEQARTRAIELAGTLGEGSEPALELARIRLAFAELRARAQAGESAQLLVPRAEQLQVRWSSASGEASAELSEWIASHQP